METKLKEGPFQFDHILCQLVDLENAFKMTRLRVMLLTLYKIHIFLKL